MAQGVARRRKGPKGARRVRHSRIPIRMAGPRLPAVMSLHLFGREPKELRRGAGWQPQRLKGVMDGDAELLIQPPLM
eukprot:5745726-Alexandrium_andersonii.AAC.1